MSDIKYTVAYPIFKRKKDRPYVRGEKFSIENFDHDGFVYLSGIESHCSGDRLVGHFERAPFRALPLSYDHASQIRKLLRDPLPSGNYVIIPVPWDPSAKEVNTNG